MGAWFLQILIAIDQLINTLVPGGMADETLSARAYRMREKSQPYWWWLADLIDWLFFWQKNPGHCERAYIAEVKRLQSHIDVRNNVDFL